MAQSPISGWLFGRPYQPQQPFDPYAQDRANQMDFLKQQMAQYDQMMAQPNGFIPQAYQDQMRKDVDTQVKNQYAGQGQSGFTNDRLARAQNDLSMKMLDTNLQQANKQRDYIQQLQTLQHPTQMTAAVPEQVGALGQMGGAMFSSAGNALGKQVGNLGGMAVDAMFGKNGQDENIKGA